MKKEENPERLTEVPVKNEAPSTTLQHSTVLGKRGRDDAEKPKERNISDVLILSEMLDYPKQLKREKRDDGQVVQVNERIYNLDMISKHASLQFHVLPEAKTVAKKWPEVTRYENPLRNFVIPEEVFEMFTVLKEYAASLIEDANISYRA